MKFRTAISFLLLIICNESFAQGVHHSIGANFLAIPARFKVDNDLKHVNLIFSGISYFPQYRFGKAEHRSFSLGLPMSIGVGAALGPESGQKKSFTTYELPLVLDYHMGYRSSFHNSDTVGTYVGLGFSYRYVNWTFDKDHPQANSYGPFLRCGVHFAFKRHIEGMSLGMFYKVGLEEQKYKAYGLDVYLDL